MSEERTEPARPRGRRTGWWVGAGVLLAGVAGWTALTLTDGRPASGDSESEPATRLKVAEYAPADRGDPIFVDGTTLQGDKLSTKDYLGQVVVLNVWGSWCAPCRDEAPALRKVSQEFADQGVRFVGINVRDNTAAALAFERTFRIPYPSIYDTDGSTLLPLRDFVPATAVPTTVVMDRQGRVAARNIGVVREATLRALVSAAVAEKSGAKSQNTP